MPDISSLNELIAQLNAPAKESRLAALGEIARMTRAGLLPAPVPCGSVNNHIHTTYSFSPYSPAKAVYMAWQAGLTTAGIMDHDSVGGAVEFIEAGKLAGISTTVGLECRVDMFGTPLYGRRINNPDQDSCAYLALHGIPHQNIAMISNFFEPFRRSRLLRDARMCERIDAMVRPFGLSLDFERDVLPISQSADGGSVTERHILFALTGKIIEKYDTPDAVIALLQALGIAVSEKQQATLRACEPGLYGYDILNILKSGMVEKFYIDAIDECPHVTDFIKLARASGAVSAYSYLGDVGDSVTGDKKVQKFEDDYLDELFDVITRLGFDAVTYMPTRNTSAQLARVIGLCREHGFFQISGEDINQPRQSFVCRAYEKPEYAHLIDSTWTLIGHELAATADIGDAMFSEKTKRAMPGLDERVAHYNALAREAAGR